MSGNSSLIHRTLSFAAGLSRLAVGLVFVFSGWVKVADPMGMALKLSAYAAALDWDSLYRHSDLPMQGAAIALGVGEMWLGLALMAGFKRRSVWSVTTFVMSVLTLLTLWIFLTDPVADCGCFGDAWKLTHGDTLTKNLLMLALLVWLGRRLHHPLTVALSREAGHLLLLGSIIYGTAMGLYALHYLPSADFTPYAVGTDIRNAFLHPQEEQVSDAVNFYAYDPADGTDRTEELLADTGSTMLLTIPDVNKADDGCCDRINDLYDACRDARIPFYLLIAGDEEAVTKWTDLTGAAYPALFAEDTEIHALVRSNPGLLMLRDGKVVGKWSCNNLPDTDGKSAAELRTLSTSPTRQTRNALLFFLIPVLLIIAADKLKGKSKQPSEN
ncbi:MAG: DoxX family protein [Alloprevotella sp.]